MPPKSLIQEELEISHLALARRRRMTAIRERVFAAFGKQCACCGETQEVFLTLDHIYNNGARDRKVYHGNVDMIWRRALDVPWQFQILCRNCNWAKRYGVCPHKIQDG